MVVSSIHSYYTRQSQNDNLFVKSDHTTYILGDPGAVSRVGSLQVRAKEPLGTDAHRTVSKNSSRCRLLIGHKKCFVLLCPIGEQFLLCSFREFVHDSYFFNHGLSGSCTKLKKCTQSGDFQFDIKSPSDLEILSARRLKTLFQKYKLELTAGIHACIGHVLRKY